MPLLDYLLPLDAKNKTKEEAKRIEKDWRYQIPIYAVIIIDIGLVYYFLNGISNGSMGATPKEFILRAIGAAAVGGVAATAGHEFYHRKDKVQRTVGIIPLFFMLETYIYIFHIQIHHKETGIPGVDKGLPMQGQTIYRFANFGV